MTAAKRVDIISLQVVKEKSVLYKQRKVSSPGDAYELVREFLENLDREHFVVAYLDVKNQPTAIHTISVGTLSASLVHPREVFKTAIACNAASIILSHNHPSGEIQPSLEDIGITKRLVEVGDILGIKVMDHIVVGDDCYYSFKEENKI